MKRGDVKVGARLLWVDDYDRRGRPPIKTWIIVKKVGRRWAEFYPEGAEKQAWRHSRFDLDTFGVDGKDFGSPGRVWADEWEYDTAVEARKVWSQFTNVVQGRYGRPPENVDAGDIREIAKRLGLELKESA